MKEIIVVCIIGILLIQGMVIFGSNPVEEKKCSALIENGYSAQLEKARLGGGVSCRLDLNGYDSYPTQGTVAILINENGKVKRNE